MLESYSLRRPQPNNSLDWPILAQIAPVLAEVGQHEPEWGQLMAKSWQDLVEFGRRDAKIRQTPMGVVFEHRLRTPAVSVRQPTPAAQTQCYSKKVANSAPDPCESRALHMQHNIY